MVNLRGRNIFNGLLRVRYFALFCILEPFSGKFRLEIAAVNHLGLTHNRRGNEGFAMTAWPEPPLRLPRPGLWSIC